MPGPLPSPRSLLRSASDNNLNGDHDHIHAQPTREARGRQGHSPVPSLRSLPAFGQQHSSLGEVSEVAQIWNVNLKKMNAFIRKSEGVKEKDDLREGDWCFTHVLYQSRHGEIPDSSLQSTGSSRSSHSRSPSLHHMHEDDKPVPRRSHSHGYPHGHGPRGRLRFVITCVQLRFFYST